MQTKAYNESNSVLIYSTGSNPMDGESVGSKSTGNIIDYIW